MYEPLKSAPADQGTQEQKLELVCREVVDLKPWIERGAELFDQRKAGAFRYDQIEKIATHNPNLVVNTDAEQVIVAESELRTNGLPTITYTYGSLETAEPDGVMGTSIREAVCRIMEGGRDAFRQREHRYGSVLNG